ncbi:sacsin N-terminal ATP-binding-like domain-containing protein [Motilibacter aurantiacus]|uniref:sacsin N-terminal ATP-binding-like domain-containing protein n=1 Tax=Motilibacter aurantiacus TaxID=2714955 RepID=UPI00140E1222|nr:hypothetical protein [Motilibacter aurantiacus]NHC46896.1 hypothetical protein [Motilibacter aurantiacus]
MAATDDPFATAGLRERVLASWAAGPSRFREDANAEEDLVRGGYRDRLVVELAQNAVDAAARAGEPARLLLRLEPDRLVAANTGAPLDLAGVEALSTLRASAKRDGGSVGRFGVGFSAVLAVTDEPAIGSRGTGAVRWSRSLAYDLVRERAAAAPALAEELERRGGDVPVLRLPEPADVEVPEGYGTAVVLPLRDAAAQRLARRLLAELGHELLVALRGLQEVEVEDVAAGTARRLTVEPTPDGVRTRVGADEASWLLARRSGRLPAELLAGRAVEERADDRWAVTWALPVEGQPALSGVLLAPTPTDEPVGLPALLVATFPLEPSRRRTSPGPVRAAVAAEAGRAYAQLVAAAARHDPGLALRLVPGPAAAGEVDALVRRAALDALPETAFVGTIAGPPSRPRDVTVVEGVGAAALELLGADDGPIAGVALPGPAGSGALLERLGARRLRVADVADALAGLRRPPAWWHELYAALDGVPPDELGALPVPLADGRLVRGARGALLPDDPSPEVLRALQVLGARAVDPAAAHPLLERLGAVRATARAVLTGPAVAEAVTGSLDLPDDAAHEVADAVLALVAAARPAPGELLGLTGLALPDDEGGLTPAGELVLPGGELAALIGGELAAADPALVERWGADVLEAVGVLRGFALVAREDVPLDPDDIDLDVDDEDGWAAAVAAGGGPLPPVAPEVVAVRDLELVRPDAWPEALRLLSRPPLRDAVVTPLRLVDAAGRSREAASYTAWWLRAHARLDGRPLSEHVLAGADAVLAGMYAPLPVPLDPAFAAAVGVRSTLAALLAEPGGAQSLLDRLADPGVELARTQLRAVYAALAGVDPYEVRLPGRVRVAAGASTRVVDAADALVLDTPDLLPLVRERPLVIVPGGAAADLAELLGVELASEELALPAPAGGVEQPVPEAVLSVLPSAPRSWWEHDALPTPSGELDWRVHRGAVHATTLDGLARGLAWAAGAWERRGIVTAILTEPDRASELLAEADLDAVP